MQVFHMVRSPLEQTELLFLVSERVGWFSMRMVPSCGLVYVNNYKFSYVDMNKLYSLMWFVRNAWQVIGDQHVLRIMQRNRELSLRVLVDVATRYWAPPDGPGFRLAAAEFALKTA